MRAKRQGKRARGKKNEQGGSKNKKKRSRLLANFTSDKKGIERLNSFLIFKKMVGKRKKRPRERKMTWSRRRMRMEEKEDKRGKRNRAEMKEV